MERANWNCCAFPFFQNILFVFYKLLYISVHYSDVLQCKMCMTGSVDAFSLVWLTLWGKVRPLTISLLITVTMILGPPPSGLDCYAKVLVYIYSMLVCMCEHCVNIWECEHERLGMLFERVFLESSISVWLTLLFVVPYFYLRWSLWFKSYHTSRNCSQIARIPNSTAGFSFHNEPVFLKILLSNSMDFS